MRLQIGHFWAFLRFFDLLQSSKHFLSKACHRIFYIYYLWARFQTTKTDSAHSVIIVENRNMHSLNKYALVIFRAPSDCLQYYTGAAGRFKSFNFGGTQVLLWSLQYRVCVRKEAGNQLMSKIFYADWYWISQTFFRILLFYIPGCYMSFNLTLIDIMSLLKTAQ